MTVNTRKVAGRRALHFDGTDQILADAERLAAGPIRCLGNWSAGQVFSHLAGVETRSLDGFEKLSPWLLRATAGRFFRRRIGRPMPAGFKLPREWVDRLAPPGISDEEGLQALRESTFRLRQERCQQPHPFFGPLTHEQWLTLHCRHAELHLSFLKPAEP